MQRFRVDLKTSLGLAILPNCQKANIKLVLGQSPQTFMIPIYNNTVLYDVQDIDRYPG